MSSNKSLECTRTSRNQTLRMTCASLLCLGGAPSFAKELVEYECAVLPKNGASPPVQPSSIAVAPLSASDLVQFPSGASPATHMVTCARSMLVPTVNDGKVLIAGYTLSVGSGGEGDEPRVAFFVGKIPNVVFVVASGKQTKPEKRTTDRVLKEINRQ